MSCKRAGTSPARAGNPSPPVFYRVILEHFTCAGGELRGPGIPAAGGSGRRQALRAERTWPRADPNRILRGLSVCRACARSGRGHGAGVPDGGRFGFPLAQAMSSKVNCRRMNPFSCQARRNRLKITSLQGGTRRRYGSAAGYRKCFRTGGRSGRITHNAPVAQADRARDS